MSFLYELIVGPIELIVDLVFIFISNFIKGGGIAIAGVSLVINLLALPLYNIADKIQQKERDIQKKLEPRVKKIKAAFKGDEQFMILSEYYRQNGYNPIYSLRNALSILIQIPFFMAAYNYLSNSEHLKNISFYFLKNLGEPDKLLTLKIGATLISINVLPIVMTLINVISSAIYTKGFPLKEKIQVYALAAIFLVLLYNSPCGLVFYWILNNLFSLAKNIILKMKKPGKVLHILISIVMIFITLYFWKTKGGAPLWKKMAFTLFAALIVTIPFVLNIFKKLFPKSKTEKALSKEESKTYKTILIFSAILTSITIGLLLPSSVIATSPTEFSFLGTISSPSLYIVHSLFLCLGIFTFWPLLLIKMFNANIKISAYTYLILAVSLITNIYIFKHNYGTINPLFILSDPTELTKNNFVLTFMPIVLIGILSSLFILLEKKNIKISKYISMIVIALCLGEVALSFQKINKINKEYLTYKQQKEDIQHKVNTEKSLIKFNLTKTGKNVIVIFIDRAIPEFFKYALQEFPELKESYKGFNFYPNTISYGPVTITGAPAMLAGYQYTPIEMNKRTDKLLVEKHNEALLMMPRLFSEAGYDVSVSDTPWTNYSWEPDWTPFKKYPEIKTNRLIGAYTANYLQDIKNGDKNSSKDVSLICKKQISLFSMLQALYPPIRNIFYDITNYSVSTVSQSDFEENFSVLYMLPNFTDFSNTQNTYTFIGNDTPHEWAFLNPPYYNAESSEKINKINSNFKPKNDDELKGYQTNIATYKQIGHYLDYLKENNAYDNSRIIIVSDHGKAMNFDSFDKEIVSNASAYNCLLLVKDFNSKDEININNSFMTNADTIHLATNNLNVSNLNPFTGEKIENQKELNNGIINLHTQKHVNWQATSLLKANQFELDGTIYQIKDNIFKKENWTVKEDK